MIYKIICYENKYKTFLILSVQIIILKMHFMNIVYWNTKINIIH